MSFDNRFLSASESQNENGFATHCDHTNLAQFPVYGLGLSISASDDSSNRSDLFSSPSTLYKDSDVRDVFTHLFNVLKTALTTHNQQVHLQTGDSLPTPSVISAILDIISYLKRSVWFDGSTTLHSDIDILEMLESYDLSSIFSTYVAVTSHSALRASSPDESREYLTRTERLLSDYPVLVRERLAAVVSFISAVGSLCRHVCHEQHDCHGPYCDFNVRASPDYSILKNLHEDSEFQEFRPCIEHVLELRPHKSMGHMLVCLTYSAVCHFRQRAAGSSQPFYNSQHYLDSIVKTFLAFIAKLVDDCEESMLMRYLLTPEQLKERAKEDFELGLSKLAQEALKERDALSSPQQSELHIQQILAANIISWPRYSPQNRPKSDITPGLPWPADTSPSMPSLVPSPGATPELSPLPTPTSSPNFSFTYHVPREEECHECHKVFKAINGDAEGIRGRITRHRKTSCPMNTEKERHKCRVCSNVYGRSDTKLKHERMKHSNELPDVSMPKRKKSS